MPALRIYGRQWHTTSDMLPIPATLFLFIYIVYIAVYGTAIAHINIWAPCKGDGVHYIVTTAGLIGVYCLSAILQALLIYFGLQGSCFEVSRRRPVIPVLYAQTAVWVLQAFFMVYGTVILYLNSVIPNCWGSSKRKKEALTHTMVWSTWGQAIFLLLIIYLTYNSYHGQNSLKAWEKRLKALSVCLMCGDQISTPMQERKAPLPSIAQWISRLFANVDLSPTDLTEAIILAAAAQSLSRKMRLKKALRPALARASGLTSIATSSSSESSEDLDVTNTTADSDYDIELGDIEEEHDLEIDELNGMYDTDDTSVVNSLEGELEHEHPGALDECYGDSNTAVALPKDYPEEWTEMAEEKYAQTAETLQSTPSPSSAAKTSAANTASPPESGLAEDRLSGHGRGSSLRPQARHHSRRRKSGSAHRAATGGSSVASFGSSMHSTAGSEMDRRAEDLQLTTSSEKSYPGSPGKTSQGSACMDLSNVDAGTLAVFEEDTKACKDVAPTPKERFGLYKKEGRRKGDASAPSSRTGPTSGSKASSEKSKKRKHRASMSRRGDPSLPPSMAGELQAGLNEEGGGLPPSDTEHDTTQDGTSRTFLFASPQHPGTTGSSGSLPHNRESTMDDAETHTIASRRSQEQRAGQPIITPSGEVSGVVGNNIPITQALEEAIGKREPVDYGTLQESSTWARFATAAYAVIPFQSQSERDDSRRPHIRKKLTEERVRDAIVEIADIETDDLLYFSHSDVALAHLPYMIALDRKTRSVVVAIRGTMSLADLVTDAVVHPECLSGWMPVESRKAKRKARDGSKKAYAHSGITSAAKAVLDDLEANGILPMLLQPEQVRRKSDVRRSIDRESIKEAAKTHLNTAGSHAGGALPSAALRSNHVNGSKSSNRATHGGEESEEDERPGEGHEDARKQRGPHRSNKEAGVAAGAIAEDKMDSKGWKLVLTGHSLGAGAAALISLKIHSRYPDLKCWAFSPPGGLVSRSLLGWMEGWCTSVVVGKDAVPRMTVNNLSRLMDDMVTSLARVRFHKLRVIFGGWWFREFKPPPEHLFYAYRDIPNEARNTLERYHRSTARKGKAKDMFPPGRVMFFRPIKLLERSEKEEGVKQQWDCIWVTPQELIQEGILVSKKMLAHHSITNALVEALGYSTRHHPDNPKPAEEKQQDKREQQDMTGELDAIRVDGEGGNAVEGAMDMLSQDSS